MNILIVDGNEKEASDRYIEIGMETQYEVYSNVIKSLSNNNNKAKKETIIFSIIYCPPKI